MRETVNQASWKLTTILRTRRFHEVTRLVSSVQIEETFFYGVSHPSRVLCGQYWLESMRFRGASFESAVSKKKMRS